MEGFSSPRRPSRPRPRVVLTPTVERTPRQRKVVRIKDSPSPVRSSPSAKRTPRRKRRIVDSPSPAKKSPSPAKKSPSPAKRAASPSPAKKSPSPAKRAASPSPAKKAQAPPAPPVAVLMLSALPDGPPNLRMWVEWARESRPPSRVFVNGKHDWNVPPEFRDVVERIPNEVRQTAWGRASLVHASQALLDRAVRTTKVSHYCLVSDDSIPLKRLSACKFPDKKSLISYYEETESMQQLEAQATALEIWQQKRPAPFENFWVTEFANEDDDDDELPYYYDTEQIQCHSQWWVMCRAHALACVKQAPLIRRMADDYDRLFDLASDTVQQYMKMAADEMVFGTFLVHVLEAGDRLVFRRSMAEHTDANGRHAKEFKSVAQLRSGALGSRTAPFGRKIRARLQ